MARKRQQPAEAPAAGERTGADPISVERTEESPYSQEYAGRRWWIVGVKHDPERQRPPFDSQAFGLIEFTTGIQRPINADGWLALDRHRIRAYAVHIPYSFIQRAIPQIKNSFVRWQRRVREDEKGQATIVSFAAEVYNSETRHKEINPLTKQLEPLGQRVHHMEHGDVPVASYLVLIPRKMLKAMGAPVDQFYEPDLDKLPTILELDPSLRPPAPEGEPTDDEPWE